ncbi:hypothetical protein PUN28_020656 [Cardiocondyla obscurior]|uniref:Uncharacterized protein n=1 Tax=Cardiocondyla obscurior TaxID=286306 RepID=A0AAW2E8X0_9HYME
MIASRWAQLLHKSVDGMGLKASSKVAHQHQWLADGSKLLTGRDFINCNKARINLMGILGRTALIIDAQVVSEQTELNQAHNKKVNYYNDPAVIQSIKETYNVQDVKTTSITLSWKGIWSSKHNTSRPLLYSLYIEIEDRKKKIAKCLVI